VHWIKGREDRREIVRDFLGHRVWHDVGMIVARSTGTTLVSTKPHALLARMARSFDRMRMLRDRCFNPKERVAEDWGRHVSHRMVS